jgi:hypothetical protein
MLAGKDWKDFQSFLIEINLQKISGKGLKDFFEANVPLEKGLRSTSQGKLNSTSRQQTSQSFREQAIRVWNWPHLDKARWAKKMPRQMLLDFP